MLLLKMLITILEHVKSKRMRQTISVLILIDFKYYLFLKSVSFPEKERADQMYNCNLNAL